MSQPPPYNAPPPENPDRRPLPPGWIQQYDHKYKAWFYVNTQESPPRSSWVHPLGPPGSPAPPSNFAPPPGAPPRDAYGPGPGYNQGPPQQQWGGPQGGYGGGYQNYGGPPQGYGGPPQGGYGGPPGGYQGGYQQAPQSGRGWFGGGSTSPQPQVVYQQAPPKKSGMGMGTALAAGGAGLLGGVLVGEMIEDHIDDERQESYDQGFDNGADYGDGGGGDW
ncbi:hypothetical protein GLOTRDRAFT_114321 [Gloeophyllum trabeum ATCC 11539]|uniref:Uncharacterized protein n=1 Tax=Gloeophyllum trabeum (strain ATCC 11539 / FP-39264 / Madison 617) TaxID=670483 RepID=S7QK10_GLOTA|nr:uncharacterized protein GLOTRDRAFT_114321 [Gloeophyllum trabeum ATCC 11539]EPQ59712.1 hypothetical protein GLOTRDRAFT_114321 [Gloeophyllum trabeum ATCC 11539]